MDKDSSRRSGSAEPVEGHLVCFYPQDPIAHLVERTAMIELHLSQLDEKLSRIEQLLAALRADVNAEPRPANWP